MKQKVKLPEGMFEVMFDGTGSLRHFGEVDIEVEEVICLETGCAVDETIITNNDLVMEELKKTFIENYEPPGD
jgi:hypothetical protein